MRKSEALHYRAVMERAVQSLDDTTALTVPTLLPQWAEDTAYTAGIRVEFIGTLYRCLQVHHSVTGWDPENAPSLWEKICVDHTGTAEDPIPYEGNMVLRKGWYYVQQDVVYLCIRDTGNPVYAALSALTNLYVQAV